MKEISVTLEGEEAVFTWKDGQIYCQGYDLESEKAVLALAGFGRGIGVLLVAINACCKSEDEFISEVKKFVVGHQKISFGEFEWHNWPKGQLLFEYYSYSPDPYLRWGGMDNAHLTERHYKRMLADPEMVIKALMARLPQLPEIYFHSLAQLSNGQVNYYLANNKSCPIDILEILASNKDATIRWSVASNFASGQRALKMLTKDYEVIVRQATQARLAKTKGIEV